MNLPTLKPDDVSPDSPFLLGPKTSFVVGRHDGGGLVLILSQHRSERGAQVEKRQRRRFGARVQVYRVTGRDDA